jgi:hypothetical protein
MKFRFVLKRERLLEQFVAILQLNCGRLKTKGSQLNGELRLRLSTQTGLIELIDSLQEVLMVTGSRFNPTVMFSKRKLKETTKRSTQKNLGLEDTLFAFLKI